MRRNGYINSLLQQCATTCPTVEQGFCKAFDYAMYVPTQAPTLPSPTAQPTQKTEENGESQNISNVFFGIIAALFIILFCAFGLVFYLLNHQSNQVAQDPLQMDTIHDGSPTKVPFETFHTTLSSVAPLPLEVENSQTPRPSMALSKVAPAPIIPSIDLSHKHHIDPEAVAQMDAVMKQLMAEKSSLKETSDAQIRELNEHKMAMEAVLAEIRIENDTLRESIANMSVENADVIADLQKTITKLEVHEAVRKLEDEEKEEIIEDLNREIEELREAMELYDYNSDV